MHFSHLWRRPGKNRVELRRKSGMFSALGSVPVVALPGISIWVQVSKG